MHESERGGVILPCTDLPTLTWIQYHCVEVSRRRHGGAPRSHCRAVACTDELHTGVGGAGEVVADYGHVHRTHHKSSCELKDSIPINQPVGS
jgi:hypothetical protein